MYTEKLKVLTRARQEAGGSRMKLWLVCEWRWRMRMWKRRTSWTKAWWFWPTNWLLLTIHNIHMTAAKQHASLQVSDWVGVTMLHSIYQNGKSCHLSIHSRPQFQKY